MTATREYLWTLTPTPPSGVLEACLEALRAQRGVVEATVLGWATGACQVRLCMVGRDHWASRTRASKLRKLVQGRLGVTIADGDGVTFGARPPTHTNRGKRTTWLGSRSPSTP